MNLCRQWCGQWAAGGLGRAAIAAALLALLAPGAGAQTPAKGTVKGKVTDSKTHEGLPSANVTVKGTYYGASTDLDGNFTITNVNPGTYTVGISLLGYKTVQYTALKIEAGQNPPLDVKMDETPLSLGQEVVIIGEKPLFNLEETQTSRTISSEDIKASAVQGVQNIVSMQTGVVQADNEVHIRGGRTYENAYLLDGISVQDPLGGTGFGLQVNPAAIKEVEVITGGYNAEYGQATSGVVNITTREGEQNFSGSVNYKRDHFGFNRDSRSNFNTDILEMSLSGPLAPKLSFFSTFYANLTDDYTRWTEKIVDGKPQGYVLLPEPHLVSSIASSGELPLQVLLNNTRFLDDNFIAPRKSNNWSWLSKLTWRPSAVFKLSYAYSNSITIDQNTKAFQATLERVEAAPGYQYAFQFMPDSANTFTQRNIQHSLVFTHTLSPKTFYELKFSQYTAHVRADANGKYFDQYTEAKDIITLPIQYFNVSKDTIGVIPGDGFFDIGDPTRWRDHSITEYTLKGDLTNNFTEKNKFKTGVELRFQQIQMVDIIQPWYKPLGLNNDIYTVNPAQGALYAQDNLTVKGMIINFGLRFDYWFPGKFVDRTMSLPPGQTNVSASIRQAYFDDTYNVFGQRMKGRLSPRLGISHPVSDNQTLFFSYGHFSKLPRPQFVYSKLASSSARSTFQTVGNPDLNPETTVSYELGLRNQISGNDILTVTAYYKDIFDYITARTVAAPGTRFTGGTYTTYINLDYSRIRGVEVEYKTRFSNWLRATLSGSYSIATGKSSEADDALFNLQQGLEENIKEIPTSYSRPVQGSLNLNIESKKDEPLLGVGKGILDNYNLFVRFFYESGKRYTHQILFGYDRSSGRPEYVPDYANPLTELADPWFYIDLNFEKYYDLGFGRLTVSLDVQNILNRQNSQIINPVTGRAYQYGDPTQYPSPAVNDPLYPDLTYPVSPYPYDPSRYMNPRTYKFGLAFSF